MFDLNSFIEKYVTKRQGSMFMQDITEHKDELFSKIQGKSVLVIGGAGSIGSSFIRAILPFKPAELIIADVNENGLTELTRDLRSGSELELPSVYIPYPMDYSSMTFERMFRHKGGFDIVANFSAHKHVRSEKDIFSVEALIRNNVINAGRLLELLSEFPPEEYFCVSTDKAANPVNIMGASKRVMEDLIFSFSDLFPVKTARFANVAFSNGSLPDGFLRRIEKLQPLSGPSDVRRYFVSPLESGQICMLSAALCNSREIIYPKLRDEQMMTFDGIGLELLKEKGYEPVSCSSEEEAIKLSEDLRNGSRKYPVYFSVSDTSGEKPYEEFYTQDETIDETRFNSLGVITQKEMPDRRRLKELITDLDKAFKQPSADKEDIVELLAGYLPDFKHIETGRSLDDKM